VDLRPKGLTGKAVEQRLERVGIALNKNTIPFDPQKPMICSGVRIGTPTLTTRGMGPTEMRQIAGWILEALDGEPSEAKEASIRERVRSLCQSFPYSWLRSTGESPGSGASNRG
jgi:glycine hydroxymethyltransferase